MNSGTRCPRHATREAIRSLWASISRHPLSGVPETRRRFAYLSEVLRRGTARRCAVRRTFPARRSVRNLSPRNGEPLYPMKSSTRSAALCIACSALCAACLAFRRIDGLSIAPAATIETTAPAIAPVAMPETKGEIRIKDLPPFIKFIESVCPLVPQILHSKKLLVWHNRLFTIACSYYIIYLTIRL